MDGTSEKLWVEKPACPCMFTSEGSLVVPASVLAGESMLVVLQDLGFGLQEKLCECECVCVLCFVGW